MTEPTYELRVVADRHGATQEYAFGTRDGLVSKDELRGADRALIDHVGVRPGDDVLVIDGNYGAAGIPLAGRAPGGETVITETSARAVATCRDNADRNGLDNVTVELTPDVTALRDGFDVAVYAPTPYTPTDVAKQRIVDAVSRLATGGTCYVAGRKDEGIARYAGVLSDHLVDQERVAVEDGHHVYRAEKPESVDLPTFLEDHEFRASVGDYTCRFLTVPGLFSWRDLDDGTAALLRAVSVPDGARVLDCCCGYGAVGAFVGARTDCRLWATDDDVVATTYAEQNFERNGVSPEAVRTGDCIDAVADERFDVVLSNPPTHQGRGVTEKLFSGIHDVLAAEGELYLVANEIMGYDDRLEREFPFETAVVSSEDNFDVIRATPR